ncbi:hypothetical protein SAMN05421636_103164 [Pricia antarctica]|uniref:Por secretion system C-terminal sorting domain-containing protein n=2 Tax=Pricia antarctica TaxID=641691 RepID=A0A1G6ZZD0_9FLAO|nr:hypothetical protein SAMN05421636_103164 [Pricia antarctica]
MISLLFATVTGMANDEKLSVETKKESKNLIFEMDSQKDTEIKLFDAANHVIYFEKVSHASYSKSFNLKNLTDGLYYFTTEDALRKIIYTIVVKGTNVEIIRKNENAKPVFRMADRMVYLNLLNLSKEDVKIHIYDSSDRLVFSEKRENEMIIEKALNFKKAYKDRYSIVVMDSENTYYESIVVQ